MRKGLIAIGVVALLNGCASASPPPGGPEDKAPPLLVRVSPDTNSVNFKGDAVSFYFDETINDRGTGSQAVDAFFLVSPSDGAPRVSWHRSRIDVKPRHGWRANTAYTITLLPGLGDLRGNLMKKGASVTFATGPTIPTLALKGVIFDWVAEQPAPKAFIEALTPDSIRYLAQSDSSGRFSIGPLGPGTYLVRGIIDQNSNRALDRNEPYDSVKVTAPQAAPLELLAAPRDTLPARIQSVATSDSVTLKVTFDRVIDPAQVITAANFRLIGADSVVIPITSATSPRQDREAEVQRARAELDSARHADSVAGRPIPPRPAATPPSAANDKAPAPPPTPSRPGPYTIVTLRLGKQLAHNALYRLSTNGVRALSGKVQASERQFTTPRLVPKPDSTSVSPKDSAARRAPAAARPDTSRAPRDTSRTPPRTPPAYLRQ